MDPAKSGISGSSVSDSGNENPVQSELEQFLSVLEEASSREEALSLLEKEFSSHTERHKQLFLSILHKEAEEWGNCAVLLNPIIKRMTKSVHEILLPRKK